MAVEQAPQRAVRAALALQEAVAQLSTRLEQERGVSLQMRVGIHTGPVIVGTLGKNLRMDYKAVGNTVNLAARMEQTAAPGTIQITEQTYKLVAEYIDCDDVGLVDVKGACEKVRVYRVTGAREARTRIDVAREHGFTHLVGRERELTLLRDCFALVQQGRGQAVSIVGDAGIGKSRLLYECRQMLAAVDLTWMEGRCSPYGAAPAYLPIVEVVKQYLDIAADGDGDVRHLVSQRLEALGADAVATVPYLLRLLDPEGSTALPAGLPSEVLKQRFFAALQWLLGNGARRRPVVLAIEDLHWADHSTVECLSFLLEHMAGTRILLLCTYRLAFTPPWIPRSYHHSITLSHLTPRDSRQMVLALLGPAPVQEELVTFVLDRTEGVPFFVEELVQSLRETGAIVLHDGQWALTAEATSLQVPNSVEEVLMARIDRLPAGAKRVLQTGAVIGREFAWELLKAVSDLADYELLSHLDTLRKAELLYERGLSPHTTYLFKHAFTQEAAYRSLLTTQRRALHHRVASTLEILFPDRLEEYAGQLAYHFLEAAQEDEMAKAIDYAVRAGDRHMALPAYAEAVRFYQMALEALESLERADETQHCELLLAMGEAQRKAGATLQALETLQCAADRARWLGSAEHLARAALEFGQATWRAYLPAEPAMRLLQEALQGLGEEDTALRARTLGSLSRALLYMGAHEQAAGYTQQMVEAALRVGEQAIDVARRVGDPEVLAFDLGVMLNVPWGPEETEARLAYATEMLQLAKAASNGELISEAHSRRMLCLLELGNMQDVNAEIDAMVRLDEELRQPSYLHITTGYRAMRALLEGRFTEAEQLSLQALELGQWRHMSQSTAGTFGLQMFTLRREQGGLQGLEPVLKRFMQEQGATAAWRPGLALLYTELGREPEACAEFEHLAQQDFAALPRDALWIGCITYLTEVCAFLGDAARAAVLYQLLGPYAERTVVVGGGVACYGAASRYLGMLATSMAHWQEAEEHFEEALTMNASMGARPWLAHTQHDYATMLLARNQPGDGEKAMRLLDEALTTAQELGMRPLEERLVARLQQPAVSASAVQDYPGDLSQREVDVLRLITDGKSNRDIADILCISLNTVASHVRHILAKTGAANRTEAAAYATRHGLRHG